jgi:hypothetical protein
MKEELCSAFCGEIEVREVPAGLVVKTPFRRADGDAVSFYVVTDPRSPLLKRIEDDGETIPLLEAAGVDLETQTRAKAFRALLDEYGADYDESEALIYMEALKDSEVPRAAIGFSALLLRLADFLLLTQEHVESTFKEDAAKRIKEKLGDRAIIKESEPVSPHLAEVTPDMVLQSTSRAPVAVFLIQSATRAHEAIFLQMAALYEAQEEIAVIGLLESEDTLTRDMHRRARNRLTAVTTWDGDDIAAVQRIEREVVGAEATRH